MDSNTAEFAQLLVNACVGMGGADGPLDKLELMVSRREVSSSSIAQAIGLAFRGSPAPYWVSIGALGNAFLQRQLTAEHVAAQERMSAAADALAKASHELAHRAFWIDWAALAVAVAALIVSVLGAVR